MQYSKFWSNLSMLHRRFASTVSTNSRLLTKLSLFVLISLCFVHKSLPELFQRSPHFRMTMCLCALHLNCFNVLPVLSLFWWFFWMSACLTCFRVVRVWEPSTSSSKHVLLDLFQRGSCFVSGFNAIPALRFNAALLPVYLWIASICFQFPTRWIVSTVLFLSNNMVWLRSEHSAQLFPSCARFIGSLPIQMTICLCALYLDCFNVLPVVDSFDCFTGGLLAWHASALPVWFCLGAIN